MVTISQDPSVPNASLAPSGGRAKISLPAAASGGGSGTRAAATLSLGPSVPRQAVQTAVVPTASGSGTSTFRLNLLA